MAQNANQLVSTGTMTNPNLRVAPALLQPKPISAGAAAIAHLTPMAFNTSTSLWTPFQNGGANGTGTIDGFMWAPNPGGHPRHATDETQGVVMLAGDIHVDDIPIISGYTLAELKAALVTSLVRSKGITVQGIEATFR